MRSRTSWSSARVERVDGREGLVEQQDLRARDERTRDCDALLHPAGELPRMLVRHAVEAQLASIASARAILSRLVTPAPRSGNMTFRITFSQGKSERL